MNGDRRIKRGTVIYFEQTNEFCYVDSVSQSYDIGNKIDRVTTLKVSRCMVKDYLERYFKIINLEIDDRVFNNSNVSYLEFVENVMSKWRVDDDIFNFFLTRKQFVSSVRGKLEININEDVKGLLR